ncbi:hypothetical protein D9M69_369940 [compost metagenome]
MVDHLPGDGDLRGHVGQAEGHGLVLDDRLAEGLALMGVVPCRLEGRTGHAHGLSGDADAAAFQVGQGDTVAISFRAQAQRCRYAHLVQLDLAGVRGVLAEFFLHPHHLVAGGIGGDDEGADALLAGLRIGDGEDDHHAGMLAGGDELLGAVQHVMIAVAARAGAQVAGIGTGLGLGEGEGADHLARGQRLQEALLLLLAAVFENGHAAHRIVHAHDRGAGAVTGGDLLQGHGVGEVAGGRAAPLLGHQHAEKAQLGHLAQCLGREAVFAVPGLGEGFQPLLGELAGHVADLDFVFVRDHHALLKCARWPPRWLHRHRCTPMPRPA